MRVLILFTSQSNCIGFGLKVSATLTQKCEEYVYSAFV